MPTIRKWVPIILTIVSANVVQCSPALAADSPSAVVQKTADQVVAILQNKKLPLEQRQRKIEDVVYGHFDFDTLSQLVLAKNWKEFSPQQRVEFIEAFKHQLSVRYGKNVETYNGERAEVTDERTESDGDRTVMTKIVRPGASDIAVSYRLRMQKSRWQVIDVIIEGISLVANYRSQFQEIMANGGPSRVLEILRQKNAQNESLSS